MLKVHHMQLVFIYFVLCVILDEERLCKWKYQK